MDACGSEEKPILWSNEVWEGDPGGDVTVDFRGRSWKVRKDIVSNQFPWIKDAIARTKPVSSASSAFLQPMLIRRRAALFLFALARVHR